MNLAVVLVWLVVVASALVQIGVSHGHRQLVQQWQTLDSRSDALQQEQTRLVLELAALTSYARIDQRARRELNMIEPQQVRILPQ
ncbi:cell division protein FtsL [Oceanobacter sp. 5_MG-2023]|uniref:cell division protein FtsL n=1 Tax=Oceanobacter sp. 5_MG-2023 TaxID=3062645 RepID=UPI0026E2EDE4|nr:cell division protein FtsL [Oceanobacter sp. 5_MG-2023]MDO6682271.1 cell division protein FtsL [Oceanobacter sp. 5_MG-2023]